MKHEQDKTFRDKPVELDGKEFDGCTFQNCQLIYRATGPVSFANCSFSGFTLVFEDAAGSTIDFLTALYHGGFKATIDQTFKDIRAGKARAPRKGTVH